MPRRAAKWPYGQAILLACVAFPGIIAFLKQVKPLATRKCISEILEAAGVQSPTTGETHCHIAIADQTIPRKPWKTRAWGRNNRCPNVSVAVFGDSTGVYRKETRQSPRSPVASTHGATSAARMTPSASGAAQCMDITSEALGARA